VRVHQHPQQCDNEESVVKISFSRLYCASLIALQPDSARIICVVLILGHFNILNMPASTTFASGAR